METRTSAEKNNKKLWPEFTLATCQNTSETAASGRLIRRMNGHPGSSDGIVTMWLETEMIVLCDLEAHLADIWTVCVGGGGL